MKVWNSPPPTTAAGGTACPTPSVGWGRRAASLTRTVTPVSTSKLSSDYLPLCNRSSVRQERGAAVLYRSGRVLRYWTHFTLSGLTSSVCKIPEKENSFIIGNSTFSIWCSYHCFCGPLLELFGTFYNFLVFLIFFGIFWHFLRLFRTVSLSSSLATFWYLLCPKNLLYIFLFNTCWTFFGTFWHLLALFSTFLLL